MDRRQFIGRAGACAATAAALGVAGCAHRAALGADDVSEDISLVREALAIHPGVVRYLDAAEFAREFDRFAAAFRSGPDLAARYIALTRFLSTLRCGHTHANFYNQSDAVRGALFEGETRYPFLFRWIDGSMVVTRDLTGEGALPPGTVVREIDGTATADVLDALVPLARADGDNLAKRIAQLEVPGGERFPAFDIFQGLLFPPRDVAFRLSVQSPEGRTREMEVHAISAAERLAAAPPPSDDASPMWRFDMRDDGVAVLTMPTWVVYRSGWDWGGWLLERAPVMYGARGLVIDIRGNEGGLSCGDPILARLAAKDIVLDDFVQRVRFRTTPASLDAHVDVPDPSFRSLGEGAVPVGKGFLGPPPGEPPRIIQAEVPRLTTPTAILIDAHCSSATFLFALRAKRHRLASIVGGASGGNLRGINGGAVAFVRLPQTGLEFDVPLIGYFATTPQPNRGLLPDIAVAQSAADIAAGADPVLDAGVQEVLRRGG